MPIYEYRCDGCGHELEAMQKFSDAALTECPSCGKPALRKLVSAAGFQLKGSGWYATDFKNKGSAKATEKKADAESSAPAASDTKKSGCGSGGCGHQH